MNDENNQKEALQLAKDILNELEDYQPPKDTPYETWRDEERKEFRRENKNDRRREYMRNHKGKHLLYKERWNCKQRIRRTVNQITKRIE